MKRILAVAGVLMMLALCVPLACSLWGVATVLLKPSPISAVVPMAETIAAKAPAPRPVRVTFSVQATMKD